MTEQATTQAGAEALMEYVRSLQDLLRDKGLERIPDGPLLFKLLARFECAPGDHPGRIAGFFTLLEIQVYRCFESQFSEEQHEWVKSKVRKLLSFKRSRLSREQLEEAELDAKLEALAELSGVPRISEGSYRAWAGAEC